MRNKSLNHQKSKEEERTMGETAEPKAITKTTMFQKRISAGDDEREYKWKAFGSIPGSVLVLVHFEVLKRNQHCWPTPRKQATTILLAAWRHATCSSACGTRSLMRERICCSSAAASGPSSPNVDTPKALKSNPAVWQRAS